MPSLESLEAQTFKTLQAQLAKYERELQKILAEALNDIRGEMSKIYEKYAVDGVLTRAEMTRYNKYATMEKNILARLDPALKSSVKEIDRLLPTMYNEAYFRYAWAIDNGLGIRLDYGTVNTNAIKSLFTYRNPKNIEYAQAINRYLVDGPLSIRSTLTRIISQGLSYTKAIAEVKATLGKLTWEAVRIIRTEGIRAFSQAQFAAYETAREEGVRGNDMWVATLDDSTRDSHGDADGQMRGELVDGGFLIDNEPAQYPLDPNLSAKNSINCRCRLRFVVDGFAPDIRREREGGVIPYVKYSDWIKGQK